MDKCTSISMIGTMEETDPDTYYWYATCPTEQSSTVASPAADTNYNICSYSLYQIDITNNVSPPDELIVKKTSATITAGTNTAATFSTNLVSLVSECANI